jgi:hypothetical protein
MDSAYLSYNDSPPYSCLQDQYNHVYKLYSSICIELEILGVKNVISILWHHELFLTKIIHLPDDNNNVGELIASKK